LRQGENSVLVSPGDTAATVTALRGLAADPARTAALGAGALTTAADLTWDARARRISAFLDQRVTSPDLPPADHWSARAWLSETLRWALPFK
jgi:glycosyltransferase involved in cell wall biosynthesis